MKIIDFIKSLIYTILIVSTLVIIVYFFVNLYTYIDVFNLCRISIHDDFLQGNKKSIFDAIKLMKKQDHKSYGLLCKYVDTIKEDSCPNPSANYRNISYAGTTGCYIRGSKIIQIIPASNYSEALVKERVKLLKKYSSLSADYWKNNR